MEWLKRMMDAVDYVEIHLEEPYNASAIARVACSSSFHFQRMFHMLTGSTVAEYIRKRKLTLAAQELSSSKVKIIDIALKYGYDTPESFSKAFRRVHGISPSAARGSGVILKAYPKISFQISLKGDQDMDYKIVEKEAFQVMGKALKVSTRDGENLKRIPEFWTASYQDGSYEKLCGAAKENQVLGICLEMDHEKEEFIYMIGVKGNAEMGPDYSMREIPRSTWAVFTSVGSMPGAIQKVWERIFHEWFPATGYEHAGTPELEVYPFGDVQSETYTSEVWVPIIKK